jgi:sugar/nucleoside kinase (ribokinase family)
VAECDIVKFSDKRISLSISEKLLLDLKEVKAKTKMVIITHESLGTSYSLLRDSNYSNYKTVHVKPLTNVIDSSGAGDWLSAAFINYFIKIYPEVTNIIDESIVISALQSGQAHVEKCCSSAGALGSLIDNKGKQIPSSAQKCQHCKI